MTLNNIYFNSWKNSETNEHFIPAIKKKDLQYNLVNLTGFELVSNLQVFNDNSLLVPNFNKKKLIIIIIYYQKALTWGIWCSKKKKTLKLDYY